MSKNKLPNNLQCPICEKPIDFVKQIYEWDMYYGDDVGLESGGNVFINIFCEFCDKPRLSVYIETGGMEVSKEMQVKIKADIDEIEKEKN